MVLRLCVFAVVLHVVTVIMTIFAASKHWDLDAGSVANTKHQYEQVEMAATAMAVCSSLATGPTVIWYGFVKRANDYPWVGTLCIFLFLGAFVATGVVKAWILFGDHAADRDTKHDEALDAALYLNMLVCASIVVPVFGHLWQDQSDVNNGVGSGENGTDCVNGRGRTSGGRESFRQADTEGASGRVGDGIGLSVGDG